jgi:hypothetical protein
MMKTILKKILLTLLVITLVTPSANAGVVKQLVEVDPQQQQIEEEEVRQQQEEYRNEVQQKDIVEQAKRILDEQIEEVPPPAPRPAPVAVNPAKMAKNDYSGCFICKPIGVLTGLVVSPIAGLVRGAVSKGGTYASSLHEGMGGGVFGKLIGYPVGAVSGGVTGAVSGLGNGVMTGVVKGYTDPFTAESYSLYSGDYDPYNFIGGQ